MLKNSLKIVYNSEENRVKIVWNGKLPKYQITIKTEKKYPKANAKIEKLGETEEQIGINKTHQCVNPASLYDDRVPGETDCALCNNAATTAHMNFDDE